jgi:hypothetical protein
MKAGKFRVMVATRPSRKVSPGVPKNTVVQGLELCDDHRKKRWVMATYDDCRLDGGWAELPKRLNVEHLPFIVAKSAFVPEVFMMYQVGAEDIHRPKTQLAECAARHTFTKRGIQAERVRETIQALLDSSSETYGNLHIEATFAPPVRAAAAYGSAGSASGAASGSAGPASGAAASGAAGSAGELGPMYDDILSVVLEWGVSRFTSFIEDCRKAGPYTLRVEVLDLRNVLGPGRPLV